MATHTTVNRDFLTSSTITAIGAAMTSSFDLAAYSEGQLFINVTAASAGAGSPTLDLVFETSSDGGTTWYTHTTIAQITTVSNVRVALTNFGSDCRVKYTLGGTTPSMTFSLRFKGKT